MQGIPHFFLYLLELLVEPLYIFVVLIGRSGLFHFLVALQQLLLRAVGVALFAELQVEISNILAYVKLPQIALLDEFDCLAHQIPAVLLQVFDYNFALFAQNDLQFLNGLSSDMIEPLF